MYMLNLDKPSDDNIGKYRLVFHSSLEDGRRGTTILVIKNLSIIFSETSIPDTVLLVLQIAKATVILAGTYFSQRINDKPQKLILILETLYKLVERYNNPLVLLFGDLNMNELSVRRILERSCHLTAHLKLRIVDNYISPSGFPLLATRRGTNKLNTPIFSRLDYILTNGDCIISTEFVENLSDHIFFNLHLNLRQSSVRGVLSTDRNQINREKFPLL